jgi:tetratricopeptide (TPR) repeat protein
VASPSRIDELRRRVQQDPASIAFAQLAEEYRREGQLADAVATCRAGLSLHPEYVSARVTLGRALLALDQVDDARAELSRVLESAPENLAATRALADACRRQGLHADALRYAREALKLAPNDPELERLLHDIDLQASAGAPPAPSHRNHARALATLAALESWLEAIRAARPERRA